MKKTLTKLFSFSLFALLSSFSLFANSATFTADITYTSTNKDTCSFSIPSSQPNAFCKAAMVARASCGGSLYCPCTVGTPNCQANGRYAFTQDAVFRVHSNSCPTNSTLSGSTCTPNTGFSAINTDPSANGGTGSWSVVSSGSECTSQPNTTYNSTNGLCEASEVEPSAGIMSSAYGIAAIGAGVVISGIALVFSLPILVAGGLSVAAAGALFATTGLSSSYEPQTPQEAINATKPPLTVIVNPNSTEKQQTPNDGGTPTIIRDTDTKTFKPGGGASGSWQQGATGSWEYGVQIPPSTVRTPRATISPDGKEVNLDSPQDNQHTVPVRTHIKNFDDNSILVGWGANLPTTDSNNNPTYLPVADIKSFDSFGQPTGGGTYVSPKNTNGTDSNFGTNTPISAIPPSSGTGTGSGTGSGTSSGGPCVLPNGTPCASDNTLQQINQSLNAGGENLTKGDTSQIEQANEEYTGLLQSVMNPIEGISSFVPSILPSSAPVTCKPIDLEINFTTGVLAGISTGKSSINICPYLDIFRDLLAWLFSISTIIYIWRVFTRSNSGGDNA